MCVYVCVCVCVCVCTGEEGEGEAKEEGVGKRRETSTYKEVLLQKFTFTSMAFSLRNRVIVRG